MERRGESRAGRLLELGTRALVALGLAAAAWIVLGRPELRPAADFLTGSSPSFAEALAALQVIIWLLVALTLLWTVLGIARTTVSRVRPRRPQTVWGGAVLTAGMLIMLVGLSHHQSATTVSLGGGSLAEARGLLGR